MATKHLLGDGEGQVILIEGVTKRQQRRLTKLVKSHKRYVRQLALC